MIDTSTAGELARLVDEARRECGCTQLAWAIAVDGRPVIGEHHDTVFRIASMTKSFTAAAVLALRDDRLLDLDVPVATYAPELASIVGPDDSPPITLRHLLSMSSGLATDDPWADRHLDIDEAAIDAVYASGLHFARRVGLGFEYSNLGFAMIGRVVRRATGRPLQDHVTERLLRPLGLTSTGWHPPTGGDVARPHRRVDGVTALDPLEPLGDGEISPMGGLWSTVRDLAAWIHWLDGGAEGALAMSSRRKMSRPHTHMGTPVVAGRPAPTAYGLGLHVRDDPDLGRVVSHSGGLPGFGSNMRWVVGRGVGAIALADVTYAPMWDLTMRLLLATTEPLHAADEIVVVTRRLVALLDDWSTTTAATLFADNVALDIDLDRRARDARAVIATHGRLSCHAVQPASRTSATAEVVADDASRWRLTVQLAPVGGVQTYEFAPW
ncbi:MAG: serine hydrolase domain-containing protein [Ilumatobacteraceae bacterium]